MRDTQELQHRVEAALAGTAWFGDDERARQLLDLSAPVAVELTA
jgi:hypothetical protein